MLGASVERPFHQRGGVAAERRTQIKCRAVAVESHGLQDLGRAGREEALPRRVRGGAHAQFRAAVGRIHVRAAHLELRVGDPRLHVTRILRIEHQRSGVEVEAVHVEHAAIPRVHLHKDLVGMVFVHVHRLRGDALDRREVPHQAGV